MTPQNLFPYGFKRALAALYSREPVTDAERQEHRQRVAAEMARAEARRKPSPQLEFPA